MLNMLHLGSLLKLLQTYKALYGFCDIIKWELDITTFQRMLRNKTETENWGNLWWFFVLFLLFCWFGVFVCLGFLLLFGIFTTF